jgi:exosortase/archaeosortase
MRKINERAIILEYFLVSTVLFRKQDQNYAKTTVCRTFVHKALRQDYKIRMKQKDLDLFRNFSAIELLTISFTAIKNLSLAIKN